MGDGVSPGRDACQAADYCGLLFKTNKQKHLCFSNLLLCFHWDSSMKTGCFLLRCRCVTCQHSATKTRHFKLKSDLFPKEIVSYCTHLPQNKKGVKYYKTLALQSTTSAVKSVHTWWHSAAFRFFDSCLKHPSVL